MQGPGGVICPADGRSRGRRGCAVFLGTLLGPDIGCAVQNSHLGRGPDFTLETLVLAPDTPALQNNLCFSYYQGRNWTLAETCYPGGKIMGLNKKQPRAGKQHQNR